MTAPSSSELKFFKTTFSAVAAENGGPITDDEAVTGSMNNVFDHVLSDDRISGKTILRKIGLKIHQDGNGYLASARFGIEPTLGDDVIRILAMTAGQYEDDLTGSERHYAGGVLISAVTAGDQSVVVDVKNTACVNDIADGDKIYLTDKYTPGSSGNGEYLTVNGSPSVANDTELTIATVETIANDYAVYSDGTGGKVLGVLEHGAVQAAASNIVQSRASGYDFTTYPLTFNNMGAIDDSFTITMQDNSNFVCVSDRLGTLAAGSKSATYAPLHPEWNKPLFSLNLAGWNGGVTHQLNDTITFDTTGAIAYVGEKQIIPVNCSALSGNRVILLHTSEGL